MGDQALGHAPCLTLSAEHGRPARRPPAYGDTAPVGMAQGTRVVLHGGGNALTARRRSFSATMVRPGGDRPAVDDLGAVPDVGEAGMGGLLAAERVETRETGIVQAMPDADRLPDPVTARQALPSR